MRKTNQRKRPDYWPLEQISGLCSAPQAEISTAGRLKMRAGRWFLGNLTAWLELIFADETRAAPVDGALARVRGRLRRVGEPRADAPANDAHLVVDVELLDLVHTPQVGEPALHQGRSVAMGEAIRQRDASYRVIREFFGARDFLEVDTPHWVEAAGTDVHLAPVEAVFREPHRPEEAIVGELHTSPEFSMKRLLAAGAQRIWQMCKVWRNGEITPLHNPEFTLLEWYRAWEDLGAIMADVEALTRALLGDIARVGEQTIDLREPFAHMTMQQVVQKACGFDLLDALTFDTLFDACAGHELLSERSLARAREVGQWDELFFELQISYIDPFLAEQSAIFVTEWPTPLAVLARVKPEDGRVAQRFELYIGGVELANGFQELTDPAEQRRRFEDDLAQRARAGLPLPPMPERFLQALAWGLPPSSGVAVGVDRYLMLKLGAAHIRDVIPLAMTRDEASGAPRWA